MRDIEYQRIFNVIYHILYQIVYQLLHMIYLVTIVIFSIQKLCTQIEDRINILPYNKEKYKSVTKRTALENEESENRKISRFI